MYQFFGGSTRMLIPDNLKTGVKKASWYNPVINRTYHEMAEHYSTAVISARVRKPRDKPNAESSVNVVSTWVLAALRNQQFFSQSELNQAIREKLQTLNTKPFKKKEGSRQSVFTNEEKSFMLPLPATLYELAIWKISTVQVNYHITVEKMHYSVPYEYIKHRIDVRITRNVIEFSTITRESARIRGFMENPDNTTRLKNRCQRNIRSTSNGMASGLSLGQNRLDHIRQLLSKPLSATTKWNSKGTAVVWRF
jgi:hypothetical protein